MTDPLLDTIAGSLVATRTHAWAARSEAVATRRALDRRVTQLARLTESHGDALAEIREEVADLTFVVSEILDRVDMLTDTLRTVLPRDGRT